MFEDHVERILKAWEQDAERIIVDKVEAWAPETVYCAAFWLFYFDYTVINCPCFALNTVEAAADAPEYAWHAPDFKDDGSAPTEQMEALYADLSKALEGEPEDVWDDVEEALRVGLAQLCRRLTKRIRDDSAVSVSDHFVVCILEERDGDEEFERLFELSIESDDEKAAIRAQWGDVADEVTP